MPLKLQSEPPDEWLLLAESLRNYKSKVATSQLAHWGILDDHSCHGEVLSVRSCSVSEHNRASGAPSGTKKSFLLLKKTTLSTSLLCFWLPKTGDHNGLHLVIHISMSSADYILSGAISCKRHWWKKKVKNGAEVRVCRIHLCGIICWCFRTDKKKNPHLGGWNTFLTSPKPKPHGEMGPLQIAQDWNFYPSIHHLIPLKD